MNLFKNTRLQSDNELKRNYIFLSSTLLLLLITFIIIGIAMILSLFVFLLPLIAVASVVAYWLNGNHKRELRRRGIV